MRTDLTSRKAMSFKPALFVRLIFIKHLGFPGSLGGQPRGKFIPFNAGDVLGVTLGDRDHKFRGNPGDILANHKSRTRRHLNIAILNVITCKLASGYSLFLCAPIFRVTKFPFRFGHEYLCRRAVFLMWNIPKSRQDIEEKKVEVCHLQRTAVFC